MKALALNTRKAFVRPPTPNFTIIVNWKSKGFGCAKVCSYCNWRDSPFLPHGAQNASSVSAFLQQCKKPFVTISGGADPLYRFDEYGEQLLALIDQVKGHGFKVRLITRELQHIGRLRGLVDQVSISLDEEVLAALPTYRKDWHGMDLEYSLVLPPLPTQDIHRLKPQYAALHRRLGTRLVLRENLNSIHPLDLAELSFGHSGIVFVSKALCLSSRYLTTVDCVGHELIQDQESLARYLMNDPSIVLFGGFVKHLVNPTLHMEYADLDVIALDAGAMQVLSDRFGFSFSETSPPGSSYPRYFLGKSTRAGKSLQVVLMNLTADALQFVMNAQYDGDRVAFSNGQFHFDREVGEARTRDAINTRHFDIPMGTRDMHLFNHNRPLIEQRHKLKLLRKGFIINEERRFPHDEASDDLRHCADHGNSQRTGGA